MQASSENWSVQGVWLLIRNIDDLAIQKFCGQYKPYSSYKNQAIMTQVSRTTANLHAGQVIWITGLSGAGKSTLCRALVDALRSSSAQPIIMLDGDELRHVMGIMEAHSRDERLQLAMRYAQLCRLIATQGVSVAIATISMFNEVHVWNRANLPGYVEVFLDVPLDELARRDPKQIYQRAARNELANVAGLDLAVDRPKNPDIHIQWRPDTTVDSALTQVLDQLATPKRVAHA